MSSPKGPPDPVMILGGNNEPVTALSFAHGTEPSRLYSGHLDGKILQWCPKRQRITDSWAAHSSSVFWIATTNQGQCLLSPGREGLIKLWNHQDIKGWSELGKLPCAALTFCNSTTSETESQIILCVPTDAPGQVKVYCIDKDNIVVEEQELLKSKNHLLQLESTQKYGMCMKLESFTYGSESRLLVGYESGTLALWDVMKSIVLSEIRLFSDPIMALACWSPKCSTNGCEGMRGVCGSVTTKLVSWVVQGDILRKDKEVDVTNAGFNSAAIRHDGKIILTGGWDCAGRVFSGSKLKPLAVLTHHRQSVQCVVFSLDNWVALGGKDGYISLWDVYKDR